MIAMTDQLRDTILSPEQRALLDTVRTSAHSILSAMDDLLDTSRIEAWHMIVTRSGSTSSLWSRRLSR